MMRTIISRANKQWESQSSDPRTLLSFHLYNKLICFVSNTFVKMLRKAICAIFVSSIITLVQGQRPNIIFIMADDLGKLLHRFGQKTFFFSDFCAKLGFNDIGYTNPDVITPNMNQLAASGVILDRNYVQPICTPTRSSLMTGMYAYKIGRQVIKINLW